MNNTHIVHWFIPNISPGFVSFLMSTNGLSHYCLPMGINVSISYEKHPLSRFTDSINIIKSSPFYIHIINHPSKFEKILEYHKNTTIHVCCVYIYETNYFSNLNYQCYFKSIFLKIKNVYELEYNSIFEKLLSNAFPYIIIHVRMHDKYIDDKYTLSSRKIKYLENAMNELIPIIGTKITRIIISNCNQVKNILNKRYNCIILSKSTMYHSSTFNKSAIDIFESIKYMLFDFKIIEKAKAVYSIPFIYSKKDNILHGGNFTQFACQVYNVPYYLLDFIPIYMKYHDIKYESMESLED